MRGQYYCENIFTGFGGFTMMQPCQIGNLLEKIMAGSDAFAVEANVDLPELIGKATRYAAKHSDWSGTACLSDEDLKLGRDLELLILIKREFKVHGPELSIVRIDLNSNDNDLRAVNGFDDVSISKYLEVTEW